MAALTVDTPIVRAIGDQQTIPAAASKIYGGSIIGLQSTGYGRSFTLGDRFAGHLLEGVDNSLGSAGDKLLVTNRGKYCLLTTLTASLANVAARVPVYAADGGTLSLTAGERVGYVINRNADGYAIVEFDTEAKARSVAQTVAYTAFTDGGSTSGYVDLAVAIPAGSRFLGWQIVVGTGFTGDTTAVVQVGVSGNVDRFSQVTSGSVLVAGTIGSGSPAVSGDPNYIETDTTVRVTVTGGADFTSISAGSMTVIYFFSDDRRE
jgi:hypothetical protein